MANVAKLKNKTGLPQTFLLVFTNENGDPILQQNLLFAPFEEKALGSEQFLVASQTVFDLTIFELLLGDLPIVPPPAPPPVSGPTGATGAAGGGGPTGATGSAGGAGFVKYGVDFNDVIANAVITAPVQAWSGWQIPGTPPSPGDTLTIIVVGTPYVFTWTNSPGVPGPGVFDLDTAPSVPNAMVLDVIARVNAVGIAGFLLEPLIYGPDFIKVTTDVGLYPGTAGNGIIQLANSGYVGQLSYVDGEDPVFQSEVLLTPLPDHKVYTSVVIKINVPFSPAVDSASVVAFTTTTFSSGVFAISNLTGVSEPIRLKVKSSTVDLTTLTAGQWDIWLKIEELPV